MASFSTEAVAHRMEKKKKVDSSRTSDKAHHMHSSVPYIKKCMRHCLPQALHDVCLLRPADPIEYLAHWLYKHMDCELYFLEKAIFQRECHLMRLELARERARRLSNIRALSKQVAMIKMLLLSDKVQLESLWKMMAAQAIKQSQKEQEAQAERDRANADMMELMESLGGEGGFGKDLDLDMLGEKKHRAHGRKSTTASGRSSSSSVSDSSSAQGLFGKMFGATDSGMTASEAEFAKLLAHASPSEYERLLQEKEERDKAKAEGDFRWGKRSMSVSKGRKKSIGAAAMGKSKEPAMCQWFLLEAHVLLCLHPILGTLRSHMPRLPSPIEDPHYWRKKNFSCHVYLDHEIYNICDPEDMSEESEDDQNHDRVARFDTFSSDTSDTLDDVTNLT